jgi:hypothetical protein
MRAAGRARCFGWSTRLTPANSAQSHGVTLPSREIVRFGSPANHALDKRVIGVSASPGKPTGTRPAHRRTDTATIFQRACAAHLVSHSRAVWMNRLGNRAGGDDAECDRYDCQSGGAHDHRK